MTRKSLKTTIRQLLLLFFVLLQWGNSVTAQISDTELPIVFETVETSWGAIAGAEDVPVQMRDGIAIAVDIYHPLREGAFPTLYAAGPFPHSSAMLENTDSDAGPLAWFINQGYAVVVANVRGTGRSEGEYSFLALEEQQDHYEIIEWIAEQPWSNGQVAGTGAGYYGTSQWHMAIQGPPSLECIAPISAVLDPLREWIKPGGVNNNSFINGWYDSKIRLANAYARNSSRLVSYDMRMAQLEHPANDDYWQIRSALDSVSLVNVPVFAMHGWSLEETDADLSMTMNALDSLNVVNKILIRDPGSNPPFTHDITLLVQELMPFYEWCFNGRRPTSSFIEKPRIRFQVRGQDTVKVEQSWPPGNIAHDAWFLNNTMESDIAEGSLDAAQDQDNQALTVFNTGNGDSKLTFASAPLVEDLEIDGPSMLELYISSTASDRAYGITVYEEDVNIIEPVTSGLPGFLAPKEVISEAVMQTSDKRIITRGELKASARVKDPVKSSAFHPVYSLDRSEQMIPGQVYRLDIALRQTSHRITAGSRLVIEISAINDGAIGDEPGRDMIHHTLTHPSRLWLPKVQSPQALRQLREATMAAQEEIARQENLLPVEQNPVANESQGDEEAGDNPVFFVPQ